MKSLLIVFVKNPILGTVKTRLAKTIGEERALEVYKDLLDYTKSQVNELTQDKQIYYNSHIEETDLWSDDSYAKYVQKGKSLGDRMSRAFEEAFKQGYDNVMLIGSDCFDITKKHATEAFNCLESKDVVIGPAEDGGYYLIGMNKFYSPLFIDKSWSTDLLRKETIQTIETLGLSYRLLVELNDIDTEDDLVKSGKSY